MKKKARKLYTILKKSIPQDKIKLTLEENVSRVGGGSFPENDLPTCVVCLDFLEESSTFSAQAWKEKFLKTNPPIIGRVEHNKFLFDVRTISEEEFVLIKNCILSIM